VPKLWDETIEAHRRGVREAILETTAGLVVDHGVRSVTMSRIAEETGIGRATLYRYFPDVEAILAAWHEQQVERHLGQLVELRESAGSAGEGLAAVLAAYAHLSRGSRGRHDRELVAVLHHDDHVARHGAVDAGLQGGDGIHVIRCAMRSRLSGQGQQRRENQHRVKSVFEKSLSLQETR
jgi:AcrR family transcriptional regulator